MGVFAAFSVTFATNMTGYTPPSHPVRRRFREFEWLRTQLSLRFPTQPLPPLPPKGFFGRFSSQFIADRTTGLQEFLSNVAHNPVFLASDLLRWFCVADTDLSVADFSMWSVEATESWLHRAVPDPSVAVAAAAAAAAPDVDTESTPSPDMGGSPSRQSDRRGADASAAAASPFAVTQSVVSSVMQRVAKWWPRSLY
jgi:hypothetical protein